MTHRPEGWYLDPDNPRAHRYWDGERWAPDEPEAETEESEETGPVE